MLHRVLRAPGPLADTRVLCLFGVYYARCDGISSMLGTHQIEGVGVVLMRQLTEATRSWLDECVENNHM